MQYQHRLLFLAAALLSALPAACCTPPAPEPDFSTPGKTLATFQGAFRADAPLLEYECFSAEFKDLQGGFDLDSYTFAREQAIDENPLLAALLDLRDLAGHIKNVTANPLEREAEVVLSILGEEFRIRFVRETIYRFEFDGNSRIRENLMPPLRDAVREKNGSVHVTLPDVRRGWLRNPADLRRVVLEEQWKFRDFELIGGKKQAPPRP
jgi:hypothetical protein